MRDEHESDDVMKSGKIVEGLMSNEHSTIEQIMITDHQVECSIHHVHLPLQFCTNLQLYIWSSLGFQISL